LVDLLRSLVAPFAEEAQEICESVTRALIDGEHLAADPTTREASIDEIARGLHTLKGSAGSLGLADLAMLAHRLEDVLAPVRRAKAAPPSAVVDIVLQGLDAFMMLARAHAASADELPSIEPVLERIAGHLRTPGEAAPLSSVEQAFTRGLDPALTPRRPTGAEAPSPDRGWRVTTENVFSFMREVERLREVGLRLANRGHELDQSLAGLAGGSGASPVRMQLVGLSRALRADAADAANVADQLEEHVKRIGTQPVRFIVDPLRRLVRDACRASGKEARLSVIGSEISVDRRLLDRLRDSLVHLTRNAVDHGIETPDVRMRAGKHREGLIVLRVEQHGNVLSVEFSDDGGGLALERLRAAALEKGIVSAAEADTLAPPDLQKLIFAAGFSTSHAVTATSGRGVGLDVVKRWVLANRGHIDVYSVAGQGTRFTLTLTVEFGSSPVLVVRVDEQEFGVPIASVERIVPATEATVHASGAQMKLEAMDRLLPLSDLGAMLALRQPIVPSKGQPILILESQGLRYGIAVDEIVGDRDLVVRAMPREVVGVSAFQGASVTARGDLVLILRPGWLVGERRPEVALEPARRALVVDDSLTARAVHRAMLEAGGYVVHTASSAAQALERLARARYDVVVCDFAMTPMDGLAFTTALRDRPEAKNTPVVMVSAREDPTLRERGLAVGADAFMSKADCAAGRLLATVATVVSRRRAS
jgi:chemotaxis protein histidine kinase CheA